MLKECIAIALVTTVKETNLLLKENTNTGQAFDAESEKIDAKSKQFVAESGHFDAESWNFDAEGGQFVNVVEGSRGFFVESGIHESL